MGVFSNMEKTVAAKTVNIRRLLLDPDRTAIININPVNGYLKRGPFYSPQMAMIIPRIIRLNEYLLSSRKLYIADFHTEKSVEFKTFPEHCVDNDDQQIVEELDRLSRTADVVVKNNPNAFLSNSFVEWFYENRETLDNILISGALTDVDIMQLALTLRAFYTERDIPTKVVVIENATATFSNEIHNAADFQTLALYNMMLNGVTIASI